ncbi:MAG: TPM domain-containing protein [Chitinophagaceae bacterium]|nr:TPM domain-containing protein [Chitinophagaceae bacterium]
MARKLGVGKKKDNGVLIVFSNQMRQTRIATGYGTGRYFR